jgi:alkylhydroperoxidase family enzyme
MYKVSQDVIDALRNNKPIADAKLEELRNFANAVVEKRGWVTQKEIDRFLSAGYSKGQLLEVIVGITQKTLSNYDLPLKVVPMHKLVFTLQALAI